MKTTCINCPMGCQLDITEINGEIVVTGNTCVRGATYGKQEYILPKRTVTSLVRLNDGGVVSVKTKGEIPKKDIFAVIQEIGKVIINRPVHIGDIIIPNVLGLGVDVVATKDIL